MRYCSGGLVVDGVQSNVVCSFEEGAIFEVAGVMGTAFVEVAFHDRMTKGALGKCDSIIGLA
jgi:hypothetical protein